MLKKLSEMHIPDPRFSVFVVNEPNGMRSITLADHYADIAGIELTGSAPQAVRIQFERARNAFLYAWYTYELTVLAEQQAIAALETALRSRCQERAVKPKRPMLKGLFDAAAEHGWLSSENVSAVGPFLVMWRNTLAHGSEQLGTPDMALSTIKMCANLINLLYPAESFDIGADGVEPRRER